MKYFKINQKFYNDNDRIVSSAEGEKIPNSNYFFNKLRNGEVISNIPILDYFYLKSFDEEKYWEYELNDVHNFIGEGSQIKGWLISRKLKDLFDTFYLPKHYYFYLSKLLYKGEKLDYYIFQFAGKLIFEETLLQIDYTNTIFWDPIKKLEVIVNDEKEFLSRYKEIYKENGGLENGIQNKKLILKEAFDFFSMQTFMKDNIVSERLKNSIEKNKIKGFEFLELDYEVIVNISL
ncbi:hypothetical protein [Flavobacterium sp. IMCC34518]|uniref:hypothetical protein n=1 Tax=Flavobacterium sp. IMCC34518 TaxID=3003623 RepID=UPI0022AC04A9|nr:hypothetical protein [Flavobacterium sp. IMCC34518]